LRGGHRIRKESHPSASGRGVAKFTLTRGRVRVNFVRSWPGDTERANSPGGARRVVAKFTLTHRHVRVNFAQGSANNCAGAIVVAVVAVVVVVIMVVVVGQGELCSEEPSQGRA
jgi:hypothetical protein